MDPQIFCCLSQGWKLNCFQSFLSRFFEFRDALQCMGCYEYVSVLVPRLLTGMVYRAISAAFRAARRAFWSVPHFQYSVAPVPFHPASSVLDKHPTYAIHSHSEVAFSHSNIEQVPNLTFIIELIEKRLDSRQLWELLKCNKQFIVGRVHSFASQ